jgi:hypothetical protein
MGKIVYNDEIVYLTKRVSEFTPNFFIGLALSVWHGRCST